MGRGRFINGLFLVGALAAAGGLAFAQEGAENDGSGDGEQSEIDVERRADLTGPQQVAEGERIQQRGNQISRRVSSMLDEARRERDIIRVTCLNDKLTQINANLRTCEQRMEALSTAVQGQDTHRRNHEFTVMTVLGQKFNVLEQEANQCLGQDIFETGATRVTTTVDPEAPDEDPTVIEGRGDPTEPYIPPPESPTI